MRVHLNVLKIWRPLRSLLARGDPGYSSLTLLNFLSIALTRTLRIVPLTPLIGYAAAMAYFT